MRTVEQRDAALKIANVKRSERAQLRAALKAGTLNPFDVLTDPPTALRDDSVLDVLRFSMGVGTGKLEQLGAMALRDRVNLLVPVSRASSKTRKWVADAFVWSSSSGRIRWRCQPAIRCECDLCRTRREAA